MRSRKSRSVTTEDDLRHQLLEAKREIRQKDADIKVLLQMVSPAVGGGGIGAETVKTWYRDLARDYHPDRHGSDTTEMMIAINDAHDRLKKLIDSK